MIQKTLPTQQLPERSLMLFRALVEHFISDGQPVGSRTLAKDLNLELSAATIRNVMADLEEMGLLKSPHISAGRVPTAKGYRLFVDSLIRGDDPDSEAAHRISEELNLSHDTHGLLQSASTMLSEITHLASVVTLVRTEQSTIRQFEFISLSNNRILVILVMNNNEIQNRIIRTARTYRPSELEQITNYLNQTFSGKDLPAIYKEMLSELRNMKDSANQLMQAAIEMARQAFSDHDKDNYVLAGQTNLMGLPGWDMERLKRLFDTFNQRRDILHLLERVIYAKGVQLFIGEESGYEVLDNCSVVTSPCEGGGILGVLGVIGPIRMDYEKVIPIVDLTAKMLGSALNSQQ